MLRPHAAHTYRNTGRRTALTVKLIEDIVAAVVPEHQLMHLRTLEKRAR